MKRNTFITKITLLILLTVIPDHAFSTGACCVIGKGAVNKYALSLAASFAKNHEILGNENYNLSQSALILKFSYPLFQDFGIQAQAGFPIRTSLEKHREHEFSGHSGFNLGVSAGYILFKATDNFELFISAGYSFSKSYLNKENENIFNQEMNVSEYQAVLIGEYKLINDLYLFAGTRFYGSSIDLKSPLSTKSGSHMGSLGYLFGLRVSVIDKIELSLEGSFGHTNLGSLGIMYYM